MHVYLRGRGRIHAKKVENSASEIFARADRDPAACERLGSAQEGGGIKRGLPRATRAHSRRETRLSRPRSSAGEGYGKGMRCAPRVREARGDSGFIALGSMVRWGLGNGALTHPPATAGDPLRAREGHGSGQRAATADARRVLRTCSAAQSASLIARRLAMKASLHAREGEEGGGMAGHLARAREARLRVVARWQQKGLGNSSRAHMRALDEVPAPSDVV